MTGRAHLVRYALWIVPKSGAAGWFSVCSCHFGQRLPFRRGPVAS